MQEKSLCLDIQGDKKNVSYILIKKIKSHSEIDCVLNISAIDFFKIYINGESLFFGPIRIAKDYAVKNSYNIHLKKGENTIAIIINHYNVATYCCSKNNLFYYIRLSVEDKIYNESDFRCYEFKEREKYCQRYSFQRAFAESYSFENDFNNLIDDYYFNKQTTNTVEVNTPELINQPFELEKINKKVKGNLVLTGNFYINNNNQKWEDRSINIVGNKFEGYYKSQLKECLSDTVSLFSYDNKQTEKDIHPYFLFNFGRNISGFVNIKLKVLKDCEIYFIFDEKLKDNNICVDTFRLWCCNIIKWKLKKGEYILESHEIYTMKYGQINVLCGDVIIEDVSIKLAENSKAYNIDFSCENKEIENIFKSAQNTLAQNSIDYLIDCPSRERALWLNDIYYSSYSSSLLMGNDEVTDYSIICVLLSKQLSELPKGMMPMCYPAEHLNGEYIPNCPMWFLLLALRRLNQGGLQEYKNIIKDKIYGLIQFFSKYINSDGLLEDLDSWIFIEWSKANSDEFIRGVNFPANMLYYKLLYETSNYFNDESLKNFAKNMKNQIIKQSFDGKFFEDNRIREDGKLVLKNHISEVCQYYAFFSGICTVDEYKDLYQELVYNFGCFRETNYFKEIDRANIIVGLLMRADIMNDNGECERVIKEIISTYGIMSKETDTLWENTLSFASCNHCIASYSAVIILKALIGCNGLVNGEIQFTNNYCKNINCNIILLDSKGKVNVKVNNGKREIVRL